MSGASARRGVGGRRLGGRRLGGRRLGGRRLGGRRAGRLALAVAVVSVAAAVAFPASVAAHPLGNFTINHYGGLRVEPEAVRLDVVIDQAEIPTFQARLDFDTDGDADVTETEIDAGRVSACTALAADLHLAADDAALDLTLVEAGLTFPLGAGGLATMRLVCGFEAVIPTPITGDRPTRISFTDGSFEERLGWREIVAEGSGTTIGPVTGELRPVSISARLTAYPEDRVARPLADEGLTISAIAGGASLEPIVIDDAEPIGPPAGIGASPALPATPSSGPTAPPARPTPTAMAAVPGGVGGGELPSIFREADLTPFVILLSIMTAATLGAGHALTPGHGKTLMAAYLVGTRGTPVHALGLGASVSLSHTIGILVLAAVIVGAADILPADTVVRAAPVIAAISIVAIGGWMLLGEVRRRRAARVVAHDHPLADDHDHDHDHGDDHGHAHAHASQHAHDDPADHEHAQGESHDHGHAHNGEHAHGGVRHSHLPPAGASITWRSLFVLGLAGGLIPSTSALLILLGSIAAGRPEFGFVLVLAFGLGMAAVMTGIGLAMVFARGRLDGASLGRTLGRVRETIPLAAAVLVFGFGLYLTAQAIAGTPTL